MMHAAATMSSSAWGRVTLLGAGPGDPELLTLKAVRVLGEAEVVLLDDLANPAVLDHVPPAARVIPVGKRGGCRSTPQAFINRLMLRYARHGKRVVRVKGGDPFLFGRGGEEQSFLRHYGVVVDVVSGITSGLAAATSIGVPLTHRHHTHGVTFITGHSGDERPIPWEALAQTGTTLVIYMGMSQLAQIVPALRRGGLAAHTPVAVVQWATLPQQRQVLSTLAEVEDAVCAQRLSNPAIVVVGEVVREAGLQSVGQWLRAVA